ncbi:MAG: hypothetical protein ACRD1V_14375 [Vicinamibacterales bacterium]
MNTPGTVLRGARFIICAALASALSAPARAQTLPSEPISIAGGRVTIGGDVSASVGSADPGFFNYTDYEHSALRLFRVDVAASLKAGDHVTLLAEIRTENADTLQPYAVYARIRPWSGRALDIQVGRVPPTFGAFARRIYASDNPLIGYPLAYQYLTTLRPDAVPASADELLRWRGLGWRDRFSIGQAAADRGVPLVSVFRWDTGVQLHAGRTEGPVNATASVTSGTLANPLFKDDNGGPQFAGRVEARPAVGLVLGASAARGPFVSASAAALAAGPGHDRAFTQTAWGADAEYSRGYYLLRLEAIISDWRLPVVAAPALASSLRAVSTSLEGRYRIRPGLYAAARVDHLGFSDVTGTSLTEPWDAPVTRVEAGGGYSVQRNLLLKVSVQRDLRDGGPLERQASLIASQIVFWF